MSSTTSSWFPFLIQVRILTLSNLLHHPARFCEIMNRIREGPSRDEQIEPQTSTFHIWKVTVIYPHWACEVSESQGRPMP